MILTALLLGLPMLGATSTGHPMSLYLEFPPHTRYVQHAPFSWSAFALLVTLALLVGALFISLISTAPRGQLPDHRPSPFSLVGLGIGFLHTFASGRWHGSALAGLNRSKILHLRRYGFPTWFS